MSQGRVIQYPLDPQTLLRKKNSLKRQLLARPSLFTKKIAILGGSTTAEIRAMLELFLLDVGIRAEFYECDYKRYYEEIMFPNPALQAFGPDIIFFHLSEVNIDGYPSAHDSPEAAEQKFQTESARLKSLWDTALASYSCIVIQNNFELPFSRNFGNLDFSSLNGKTQYVHRLNAELASYARNHPNFHVHDIQYLSSWLGLEKWHDKKDWYAYKYALAFACIPHFAHQLAGLIAAMYGLSSKVAMLDLDNTLWGGVVGDDGPENLKIGKETALAEAFTGFQTYLKMLKDRGILLGVASKNDSGNALAGLAHPDGILKASDFSVFKANWEPKSENLVQAAHELNLGLKAMVFVDDNPAERELVRQHLPEVAVPEMGEDATRYITRLDKSGYFEVATLSQEDLQRAAFYEDNQARQEVQREFSDYKQYLASLEMQAEIAPFKAIYLDRITQLINKTNQFNLTTRRYSTAQVQACMTDSQCITLYGRLSDRFGDNGLVSVVIGTLHGKSLHIDLWLMSCRVLKRGFEWAMFDELVRLAHQRGAHSLQACYLPTAKNKMVETFYADLGFEPVSSSETQDGTRRTDWRYLLDAAATPRNTLIKVSHG